MNLISTDPVDASLLKGKTLVVFETVSFNGTSVFVHADLNDEAQTIRFPEIRTTAVDKTDGDKELALDSLVKVVDTVSFHNLDPEKTYVVKGRMMEQDGKELISKGETVTGETRFSPEESDGTVDVEFSFSTEGRSNAAFVVFEEVYEVNEDDELVLIGEHKDLTDEDQSVYLGDKPDIPKTGDATNVLLPVAAMLASIIGMAMLLYRRRTM